MQLHDGKVVHDIKILLKTFCLEDLSRHGLASEKWANKNVVK